MSTNPYSRWNEPGLWTSYESQQYWNKIERERETTRYKPVSNYTPEELERLDAAPLAMPSIFVGSLGLMSTAFGGAGLLVGVPLIGPVGVLIGGGLAVTGSCLYYLIQYAVPAIDAASERIKARKASGENAPNKKTEEAVPPPAALVEKQPEAPPPSLPVAAPVSPKVPLERKLLEALLTGTMHPMGVLRHFKARIPEAEQERIYEQLGQGAPLSLLDRMLNALWRDAQGVLACRREIGRQLAQQNPYLLEPCLEEALNL